MYEHLAVVGATGAVGTIILEELAARQVPYKTIKFLASARSAGNKIVFKGETFTVEEMTPSAFDGVQLAIASTPDETARDFIPEATKRGCLIIDESGYWRMDKEVPLVIPEVNPEAIREAICGAKKGIIASPNCSTTQLVVALKPLHDAARVRRVVVSTYQAVSGAGLVGTRDLFGGTQAYLANAYLANNERDTYAYENFAHPIAFNCIPQIGSEKEKGYTSEELKMLYETRKILGDETIEVCPTAIRVPVANCHSESILVETEKKITATEARTLFAAFPGIVVWDDLANKDYPMPIRCDRRSEVFIGRIREDISSPNGLAFWCVSDNLRKGAATNAVQIAEWIQKNL